MSQSARKETILPFQTARGHEPDAVTLDRSGNAIIALLGKAAEGVQVNQERANATVQRLTNETKAAEDRVRQLEVEIQHCKDRALRAEGWLLQICKEVEAKFSIRNAEATTADSGWAFVS